MHKKTLSGFLQIGVLVKVDWVGYFVALLEQL
jgi:hypothetical protein